MYREFYFPKDDTNIFGRFDFQHLACVTIYVDNGIQRKVSN